MPRPAIRSPPLNDIGDALEVLEGGAYLESPGTFHAEVRRCLRSLA